MDIETDENLLMSGENGISFYSVVTYIFGPVERFVIRVVYLAVCLPSLPTGFLGLEGKVGLYFVLLSIFSALPCFRVFTFCFFLFRLAHWRVHKVGCFNFPMDAYKYKCEC